MFVKKVFKLLKPFLANLHSTSSNNTHICTHWPQNLLGSFLAYEYSKYAEFYADFFAKHFCKLVVYSRREETLNILTVFGYNFFLNKFFTFISTFSKSPYNSALF
jgi:hypothetical protein